MAEPTWGEDLITDDEWGADLIVDDEEKEPVIEADTPESLRANRTPEVPPVLKQVAPGIFIPEGRSMGEYITGAAEVAGTILSGAVAEPISGLAGIAGAILPGDPGQGAEWVEGTREALSLTPTGEVGQEMMGGVASFLEPVGEVLSAIETVPGEAVLEATGSPALATIAHTAPTALLELLGLSLLRRPSKAAQNAAKAQERIRLDPTITPTEAAWRTVVPEDRPYEVITADLKRGQAKRIAEDVRPDAEIIEAAEALGVDLNPSHYSTNEAFRRVEQAVKSQAGSKLAAREFEAIEKLGREADALIEVAHGNLDRSVFDARVRGQIDGKITELSKKAELTYKVVNDAIKPATKVVPRASRAYMEARLAELGGDVSVLSKSEKMLHKMLNRGKKGGPVLAPTYAAFDQLRRNVGAGFKGKGVFADDLSGNLDQVYSVLIRDQQGIAEAMGAGAEFAAARKLVETRKALEGQAMKLFGNEMNKSLLPKLTQVATGLTKGDVVQFQNLMDALPKNMRTPAAATLLNDLFTHGARTKGSLGQGFANAYRNLNTHKGAKAVLFKYLPKDARRRFDALGIVSTGLFRAKALGDGSPTARLILQALDDGTIISRVTGAAARPVGSLVGGFGGAMAGDVVAGAAKKGAKAGATSDELLASNAFNRAIRKASEGAVKEAETMLKRSAVWKAWRNTIGEGTRAQLAAQGPIAWLTAQAEQQQPEPPPEPLPAQQGSPTMPPVGPPAEALAGVQ